MIDELDKKIIALLQKDLPLDPRPFAIMADGIGITEDQFMNRVKSMVKRGVIRRFGATLYHQEAGFSSNAMVAWVVPDDKIEETGRIMAEFREVTHCYERKPQKGWKYNLYTMIHGDNREECHEIARRMSSTTGIDEYALLFSEKEFKKTSMEYF
jgi:DNA-binding Lrp family transcriptional regulator